LALSLHHRIAGEAGPSLVLVHGLLGSGSNWGGVVRRLQAGHRLYLPDLRNHGRSPWSPRMDYDALAGDLVALASDEGLDEAWWLGHSMGGKAVMRLALRHPERVRGLIVADIAPVPYSDRFTPLIDALEALPPARIEDRRQADALLARSIHAPAVRAYLLQNLLRNAAGWRWRCNLEALRTHLPQLLDFPTAGGVPFPGPTLFIRGARSDYVRERDRPVIQRWFPRARIQTLEAAGHWLYSERPDAFSEQVRAFVRA